MMDGSNNPQRQSAPQKCEKLWRRDSMGEGGDERIRCNRSVGPHLLGFGFPSPNSWSIAMSDTREWGDCRHGIRLYRCSLCRDEEVMTDSTKPPERVWLDVDLEYGSAIVCTTTPDVPHCRTAHAYIHEDSLPGSVEEIGALVDACRDFFDRDDTEPWDKPVGRMMAAIAAMKKEQP